MLEDTFTTPLPDPTHPVRCAVVVSVMPSTCISHFCTLQTSTTKYGEYELNIQLIPSAHVHFAVTVNNRFNQEECLIF